MVLQLRYCQCPGRCRRPRRPDRPRIRCSLEPRQPQAWCRQPSWPPVLSGSRSLHKHQTANQKSLISKSKEDFSFHIVGLLEKMGMVHKKQQTA